MYKGQNSFSVTTNVRKFLENLNQHSSIYIRIGKKFQKLINTTNMNIL